MREILFRGKDIVTGKWVESHSYVHCGVTVFFIPPDTEASIDEECRVCELNNFVEVDPITMGQWTGLVDKNGVKIFEGDIVIYTDPSTLISRIKPETVVWNDILAAFIAEDNDEKWDYLTIGDYEVIGNIYDNPELLERK